MREWLTRSEVSGYFMDFINRESDGLVEVMGGLYYHSDILLKLDPMRFEEELNRHIEGYYIRRWDLTKRKFVYTEVQ